DPEGRRRVSRPPAPPRVVRDQGHRSLEDAKRPPDRRGREPAHRHRVHGHRDLAPQAEEGDAGLPKRCEARQAQAGEGGRYLVGARQASPTPTTSTRRETIQEEPWVATGCVSESTRRPVTEPPMPSSSRRSKQRRAICGETP